MSMSISSVPRALVTGAAAAMALFGVVMLAGPLESSAQAKSSKSDEDKAVTFMRTTANALIDAQRRGTPEAFRSSDDPLVQRFLRGEASPDELAAIRAGRETSAVEEMS